MRPKSKIKALTLVEMLAAVLIVALTAVFLFMRLETAQARSNRNNCLGQLRQICLAMKAYANDDVKHQLFPRLSPRPSSSNLLFEMTLVRQEYVKDARIFRCPQSRTLNPSAVFPNADTNSYSVAHNVKDDGGTDTPILADALPHVPDLDYTVFYVDGHGITLPKPPLLNERLDPLFSKSIEEQIKIARLDLAAKVRRDSFLFVTTIIALGAVVAALVIAAEKVLKRRQLSGTKM